MTDSNKSDDLNKSSLKDIVQEHTSSFIEASHEAEEKVKAAVLDTAESLKTEAQSFLGVVQDQLKQFQEDVHEQVDTIKEKLTSSKDALLELKSNVLSEFNHSVGELSQIGREIKDEVSAITSKSKEHINESYQRIRGNAVDVVDKLKPESTDSKE